MKTRNHLFSLFILFLMTGILENFAWGAPEISDEAKKQSVIHYKNGMDFYNLGDYRKAANEMEKAYKLNPKPILLYNIAKAYEKLGDYKEAIKNFQQYIKSYPEAPDKNAVNDTINMLQERLKKDVPILTVKTEPNGANVYIDKKDKLLGQTPFTYRLKPGTHKIIIAKSGYDTVETTIVMPDKPNNLFFSLRPMIDYGYLMIKSNANGSKIFIDGKVEAITPYNEVKKLGVGKHQIIVEQPPFYTTVIKTIYIIKDKTEVITVDQKYVGPRTKSIAVPFGWTCFTLGMLSMAAGITMYYLAQGEFQDSPKFKTYVNASKYTFITAGILGAGTIALLVYGYLASGKPAMQKLSEKLYKYNLAMDISDKQFYITAGTRF